MGGLFIKNTQYLSEIKNFRKSLIYEYVTGKREVPEKVCYNKNEHDESCVIEERSGL